jgi:hypothetical protein
LKNFLNQFSVSNKDLRKIKKQFIELFSELIEDRTCLENDSDIDIKNCMPLMLSLKNKCIYFWEKALRAYNLGVRQLKTIHFS